VAVVQPRQGARVRRTRPPAGVSAVRRNPYEMIPKDLVPDLSHLRASVAIASALALILVASTDLLLDPNIFDVSSRSNATQYYADPNSWFDIVAALCSIFVSAWPHRAERILRAESSFDWRGTEAVAPAGKTAVRYQPAVLIFGAAAGWYVLSVVACWIGAVCSLVAGEFWWQQFAAAVLRPLVAWNLLSVVARCIRSGPRHDPAT